MKRVSILVPEHAVVESVADPRYLFKAVNGFFEAARKPPPFHVEVLGMLKEVKLEDDLFSVHTDALISEVDKTDLIFIPALSGNLQQSILSNQEMIAWVTKQHEQGAEVASLCLGAFLLAATGLLDGKKCSTHWAFTNEFQKMFPAVEVVDGSIITEAEGLYSSGGATSYWNLLLFLVEKYTSRDMAIMAAKYFAIDISRNSQAGFIVFNGQKDHPDEEVKKAQTFIEKNFHEKISVDQLADLCLIGRRSFERRFRKATRNSVVEYMQRVKVEAAKRHFERTRKNITEVMYNVGYSDTKAFRDVFKKVTGFTPIEYRNKYQRQALA